LKKRGVGAALRAIKEGHVPVLTIHVHHQEGLGFSSTQYPDRHSSTKDCLA